MSGNNVFGKHRATASRGTKQTCENQSCGRRFYDLMRVPSACPYCGTSFNASAVVTLDFETLCKQRARKYTRWVEPLKPEPEISKVDDELSDEGTDKEAVVPAAAEELLIDIEDDGSDVSAEETSEAD